jgi:hypothetical protein
MTEQIRSRMGRSRELHPLWKGGEYTQEGRVFVQIPKEDRHLFPTIRKAGYVRRSHLVWNQHNPSDQVRPGEIVHHRNEDKSDDRIENLEKMTQSEHCRLHFSGKPKSPEHRAKIGAAQRRWVAQQKA